MLQLVDVLVERVGPVEIVLRRTQPADAVDDGIAVKRSQTGRDMLYRLTLKRLSLAPAMFGLLFVGQPVSMPQIMLMSDALL